MISLHIHRSTARSLPGFVLTLGLIISIFSVSAQADDLKYNVLRKGKVIGQHEVDFEMRGQQLKVEIETDVAVKLAFITVYRFEHEGTEIWENGSLVRYTSKTNDDGKAKFLDLTGNARTLTADGSAGRFNYTQPIMPASLWRADTPTQNALMNTLDGHMMNVTVENLGQESVKAGGQAVLATRYKLTGDLERELWYAEGVLVHVRFKGSDGSTIDYELQ